MSGRVPRHADSDSCSEGQGASQAELDRGRARGTPAVASVRETAASALENVRKAFPREKPKSKRLGTSSLNEMGSAGLVARLGVPVPGPAARCTLKPVGGSWRPRGSSFRKRSCVSWRGSGAIALRRVVGC